MILQENGVSPHYHRVRGSVAGCFLANGSHLWDLEQGPAFASSENLSLRDFVSVVCIRRVVAVAVHRGAGGNHDGLRRAVENTYLPTYLTN